MPLGVSIAVDGSVDDSLAGATWVEVHERAGRPTAYRIRFEFEASSDDFPQLTDGRLDAGSELSVLVPGPDGNECLVKGPVGDQRIHFEHGGAGSYLEVCGRRHLDHDGPRGTLGGLARRYRQRRGHQRRVLLRSDPRHRIHHPPVTTRTSTGWCSARATWPSSAGWPAATGSSSGSPAMPRGSRRPTSASRPVDRSVGRHAGHQPTPRRTHDASTCAGTSSGRPASTARRST